MTAARSDSLVAQIQKIKPPVNVKAGVRDQPPCSLPGFKSCTPFPSSYYHLDCRKMKTKALLSLIKNCLLHSRKQLQQTGGTGAEAKTLLSMWPQPEGNILGRYCRSPLRTLEAADWHFYITRCYNLKLFTQVIIIPSLLYPHALLNTALAPKTPFPEMSIFCSPQRQNAIADAQLGEEEGAGLRLSLHSRFNQS